MSYFLKSSSSPTSPSKPCGVNSIPIGKVQSLKQFFEHAQEEPFKEKLTRSPRKTWIQRSDSMWTSSSLVSNFTSPVFHSDSLVHTSPLGSPIKKEKQNLKETEKVVDSSSTHVNLTPMSSPNPEPAVETTSFHSTLSSSLEVKQQESNIETQTEMDPIHDTKEPECFMEVRISNDQTEVEVFIQVKKTRESIETSHELDILTKETYVTDQEEEQAFNNERLELKESIQPSSLEFNPTLSLFSLELKNEASSMESEMNECLKEIKNDMVKTTTIEVIDENEKLDVFISKNTEDCLNDNFETLDDETMFDLSALNTQHKVVEEKKKEKEKENAAKEESEEESEMSLILESTPFNLSTTTLNDPMLNVEKNNLEKQPFPLKSALDDVGSNHSIQPSTAKERNLQYPIAIDHLLFIPTMSINNHDSFDDFSMLSIHSIETALNEKEPATQDLICSEPATFFQFKHFESSTSMDVCLNVSSQQLAFFLHMRDKNYWWIKKTLAKKLPQDEKSKVMKNAIAKYTKLYHIFKDNLFSSSSFDMDTIRYNLNYLMDILVEWIHEKSYALFVTCAPLLSETCQICPCPFDDDQSQTRLSSLISIYKTMLDVVFKHKDIQIPIDYAFDHIYCEEKKACTTMLSLSPEQKEGLIKYFEF